MFSGVIVKSKFCFKKELVFTNFTSVKSDVLMLKVRELYMLFISILSYSKSQKVLQVEATFLNLLSTLLKMTFVFPVISVLEI